MPCLVTAVGFFVPRVVMVFLLVFTSWFSRSFETWYWPVLGFFFMPYTTLAYMISMVSNGGQISGGYVVLVVVAVFFDLGMHSDSSGKAARLGKAEKR